MRFIITIPECLSSTYRIFTIACFLFLGLGSTELSGEEEEEEAEDDASEEDDEDEVGGDEEQGEDDSLKNLSWTSSKI